MCGFVDVGVAWFDPAVALRPEGPVPHPSADRARLKTIVVHPTFGREGWKLQEDTCSESLAEPPRMQY